MLTKEPFRSLFEEARAAERKLAPAPAAAPAPLPLAQRLDQVSLAGGTPARGTFVPPLDGAFAEFDGPFTDARPRSTATDELFAALYQSREPPRALPAGASIDAALQDSLAELEATAVIPAQRRMTVRQVSLVTDAARERRTVPSVPEPVLLKPAPPPVALTASPRPPPLIL